MPRESAEQRGRTRPLIEPDPVPGRIAQSVLHTHSLVNLWHAQPPRLFAGLFDNSPPPLYPFPGARKEAMLAALRIHRHNARDAQFGRFLNRPFEAVELDQRQIERDRGWLGSGGDLFDHAELHQFLPRCPDGREPHAVVIADLELLPRFHAEHARQVLGVLAPYLSLPVADLFDKESAACHVQLRYRMIARLRGILVEKHPNQAVLDVGGVGYDVTIPISTYSTLPDTGGEVILRIYTHVREDIFALYGFLSLDEKNLFEKLIGVSGIGPGLAIKVLSGMPAVDLLTAIRRNELDRLIRIPGVGKKTAERMVLELRDKLPAPAGEEPTAAKPSLSPLDEDVLSALSNLGCARPAAEMAVRKAKAAGVPDEFEPLFRKALELVR